MPCYYVVTDRDGRPIGGPTYYNTFPEAERYAKEKALNAINDRGGMNFRLTKASYGVARVDLIKTITANHVKPTLNDTRYHYNGCGGEIGEEDVCMKCGHTLPHDQRVSTNARDNEE